MQLTTNINEVGGDLVLVDKTNLNLNQTETQNLVSHIWDYFMDGNQKWSMKVNLGNRSFMLNCIWDYNDGNETITVTKA